MFEEEKRHTKDFEIHWVLVGFGWAPEGWHLEVNLLVLIGILRHSRCGEATLSDDKLLKVDEAEGDNDNSENGQCWNVEEAGG